LVATAVAVPLIVLVLGPHLPPGRMTSEAGAQTDANVVLTAVSAPIVLLIWVYFAYALVAFRQPPGPISDGPPIKGHARMQMSWVSITTLVVVVLAIAGTYELLHAPNGEAGAGAGGGQGPSPINRPGGNPLQVQVIAQQWWFTFRYPQYGGVETFSLVLPAHRTVEFHVTSLDVVHSFWAYQLGVKADAVPGADNVAFTRPNKPGLFQIRCAELCGLWHGSMAEHGRVVTAAGFKAWIAHAEHANSPATHFLPGYHHLYYPQPYGRAG
jgi:cytochrome c oxidase subunit 2